MFAAGGKTICLLSKAPAHKPMETWCGEDVSMGNSWDQEEEVEIGMWSNSQQDSRSSDQNTWNYKPKVSNKVCDLTRYYLLRYSIQTHFK